MIVKRKRQILFIFLIFYNASSMKAFIRKILQKEIGQIIPGLEIHGQPAPYGVINERAIRATAGIMLVLWMITFFIVFSTKNFSYLYPTVIAFWIQFFITVFFGPKYAPFSLLGRLLVQKQQAEYVGAIQKRFAWALGLLMASSMLIMTLGFGVSWMLPMAICMICLAFMWLESAAGICVGCKIYGFLIEKWIIPKPVYRPACPGWACTLIFSKK